MGMAVAAIASPGICPGSVNESDPVPFLGSRCWEASSRGNFAFVAIPVDQMSLIWCEFGAWAPMFIGMFLYITHGFAFSVAAMQSSIYSAKARHNQLKLKIRTATEETL